MAPEAGKTVIARSTTVTGEITGDGDVQIDGTLDGSVKVTGARIIVGPEANVKASLTGQEIVIAGRVEGELRASGRVELRKASTTLGNIFAPRLSIEDDAVLRGRVDTTQTGKVHTEAAATDNQPKA